MLLLIVAIVIGFVRKQERRYWIFAACAVLSQNLANILFSARGTLENPNADGYITAIVREITNDGPALLWLFPITMFFAWGLPFYLLYKGYKKIVPQKPLDLQP
jgi:hypothetical protein